MSGLLEAQENLARNGMKHAVNLAITTCGVDLRLYDKVVDEFSRAYGTSAYKVVRNNSVDVRGLLTADEFSSIDALSTNVFEEGYLWVSVSDIDDDLFETGDEIGLVRQDKLIRRVKIMERVSVGFTVSVLQKFRVSNVAG